MNIQPWQKRMESKICAGFRHILRRTYLLPNGVEADFEIKHEPHAACVLALTPHDTVLLVQQFRPGPEEILLELPGGGVEPGEDPAQAAARELLEETGYRGELELAGTCWHCAYSTMLKHNFVARNCVKVQEPALDEHEFARVAKLPLEEFRRHVRSGKMTDVAGAYMGLERFSVLPGKDEFFVAETSKERKARACRSLNLVENKTPRSGETSLVYSSYQRVLSTYSRAPSNERKCCP